MLLRARRGEPMGGCALTDFRGDAGAVIMGPHRISLMSQIDARVILENLLRPPFTHGQSPG